MTPVEKYKEFLTKFANAHNIPESEADKHVQAQTTKEYYNNHEEIESRIEAELKETLDI